MSMGLRVIDANGSETLGVTHRVANYVGRFSVNIESPTTNWVPIYVPGLRLDGTWAVFVSSRVTMKFQDDTVLIRGLKYQYAIRELRGYYHADVFRA